MTEAERSVCQLRSLVTVPVLAARLRTPLLRPSTELAKAIPTTNGGWNSLSLTEWVRYLRVREDRRGITPGRGSRIHALMHPLESKLGRRPVTDVMQARSLARTVNKRPVIIDQYSDRASPTVGKVKDETPLEGITSILGPLSGLACQIRFV
ncbi:hypothetical protein C8Q74DRAFT_1215903 [Fomes fomentarius]|nr:hypothetical protein C8Q74DRAFT_1215903 [Fomes fomentarius]